VSTLVFGWPIYSDASALYTPSVSGGSWLPALPAANVMDRRLSKVARSTNAVETSSTFDVDLGVARPVRVLALVLPNISASGTARIRGSNSAGSFGSPVYDTGTITVYPSGATVETMGGIKPTLVSVAGSNQSARYWRVEVTDTGNADGYIDVARLVIAGGWQPSVNAAYGAELGLETDTDRQVTDGGSAIYDERPSRRTAEFEIRYLSDSEALSNGFDLQRLAGTSQQVFFVSDPADTTHMHRRAFLSTIRALSPVRYAYLNANMIAFTLVEEL
jgi:hypothetical protein